MQKTGVQKDGRMEAVRTVLCPLGRGADPPLQAPPTHVSLGEGQHTPILLPCSHF